MICVFSKCTIINDLGKKYVFQILNKARNIQNKTIFVSMYYFKLIFQFKLVEKGIESYFDIFSIVNRIKYLKKVIFKFLKVYKLSQRPKKN